MCGLAGSLGLDGAPAIAEPELAAMTDVLWHRGPDASGAFREGPYAVGHRRLSIIDPDGSSQPIHSEDGALVLVCNGEIFNYRELRADLAVRGHRFRTAGDAEVIVHLYEEKGPALLDDLRGQFAFALYDRRRRELLLARDHLGIIPIFYTLAGGRLVFGSEIKAVLAHPGVPRRVDPAGLDQVLTFPGLVSPRTMFEGVRSLENGHYLLVRDGRIAKRRYWDLDFPVLGDEPPERPEEHYVRTLRGLLAESVRRRLQADVPVGFYLSGGLDSSLIGALVNEVAPDVPRDSFSIAFPAAGGLHDPGIDESRFQRLMAEKISSRHHEVRFTPDDVAGGFVRMVRHAECPVKETYNTCSLALSKAVRRAGARVVLTGEGADELFAGYPGYRFDGAGRAGANRARGVDAGLEDEARRRLWGDPGVFYEREYHAWSETKLELYSAGLREEFPGFDCLELPLVDHDRIRGRHPLHQRSYIDVKLRLADHLLADHGDRAALANSVEARYPFLDLDVVEFATTIPPRFSVAHGTEKYMLKRAAEGLVPAEIVQRQKFGFRAPGGPALLRIAPEWAGDLLAHSTIERQGYFDPAVVDHLKERYLREDHDVHPHLDDDLLLVVLSFGVLLETFDLPDHS